MEFIKAAAKPWVLYVKIGLIAFVVVFASYISYTYRGNQVDREIEEAVGDAVREVNRAMNAERERRLALQKAIDERYDKLIDAIQNIKVTNTVIYQGTKAEVASNPKFYKQPLPDKGYEQWLQAREQLEQARKAARAASAP